GATSDETYETSNYVEAWYPHKDKITAVGLDDAPFLQQRYPRVTFRRAAGLALPFEAGSFDVAHSSAVLEHLGSAANQARFLSERRGGPRGAVHVPTRTLWFPIEVHPQLPRIHWLPKPTFRRLVAGTKYSFFSREEHLNLLGPGHLLRMA